MLIVALGIVVAPVSAASAAPDLFSHRVTVAGIDIGPAQACTGPAPTPQDPAANGYLSTLVPMPKDYKAADPFTDPNTSILEQYGTAGTFWTTYDNGCDTGSDWMPKAWTAMANFGTGFSKGTIALNVMLGNNVFQPVWLAALDKPIAVVGQALYESFAKPWMWVLILITAIIIIGTAVKAQIGKAAGMALFVCIGLCVAALPFKATGSLTGLFDHTVAGGAAYALSGGQTSATAVANPGVAIMSRTYDVAEYQRWLEGNFCSATSDTAKTYGPRLFKAQAFRWDESVQAHSSTDSYASWVSAKQKDWQAVAAEVKDKDPVAYDCLTGNRSDLRMGAATTSNLTVIALVPFLLTVLFMLLGAYMIVRFLVGYSPVLGTLLVLPAMHGLGKTVLNVIAACIVNILIYAAAGYSIVAFSNALLASPDIDQLLACVLILVMSVVTWIFLRPFRTLTRMVHNPGKALEKTLDAPGDAVNAVKKITGNVAQRAAGTALGLGVAGATGLWNHRPRRGDGSDDEYDDDVTTQDDSAATDDDGAWMYPVQQPALSGRVVPDDRTVKGGRPAAGELPVSPVEGELIADDVDPAGDELTATRYAHPRPAPRALPPGTVPAVAAAASDADGAEAALSAPTLDPTADPTADPTPRPAAEPTAGSDALYPEPEPAYEPSEVIIGEVVIPDSPSIADEDGDVWVVLEEPAHDRADASPTAPSAPSGPEPEAGL